MDTIQEYTSKRNNHAYKNSEYLIIGQRGSIRRDAVNTLLEKHTVRGNFEMKLKPHTFRHTFCTRLVTKGIPISTVSKLVVTVVLKLQLNSTSTAVRKKK